MIEEFWKRIWNRYKKCYNVHLLNHLVGQIKNLILFSGVIAATYFYNASVTVFFVATGLLPYAIGGHCCCFPSRGTWRSVFRSDIRDVCARAAALSLRRAALCMCTHGVYGSSRRVHTGERGAIKGISCDIDRCGTNHCGGDDETRR